MSIPPPRPTGPAQLRRLLDEHLNDPASGWSVGTFGALAEFIRERDEPAALTLADEHGEVSTARGALRVSLVQGLRAFAYETPDNQPGQWSHALALCLPASQAGMHRRASLEELGPDSQSVRPEERDAILFDLGLGCDQVDVCVRSADPEVLACLRASRGRSLFEPGNPLMARMPELSPHRVFVSRFARAEVFQAVPPADGQSPSGPHTHVLPALMREGRTHAATVPIPAGWVPCAHLFPAHPCRDPSGQPRGFDPQADQAFQDLLEGFGDPDLLALKHRVLRALADGTGFWDSPSALSREQRSTVRVALRQWALRHEPGAVLRSWQAAFEPTPRPGGSAHA